MNSISPNLLRPLTAYFRCFIPPLPESEMPKVDSGCLGLAMYGGKKAAFDDKDFGAIAIDTAVEDA